MAEIKISGLPAASSANGTMEYETNDSGTSKKVTGSQLKTYVTADLGTISTQNANNVSITGGSISGITDLAVADGGTGASTLTGYVKGNGTTAFTASSTIPNTDITGLGTMSTQAASNVSITGGSISGITDLAVADGGTGTSSLTANNVILGNGTSAVQFVAPSTSGNVLTSNGTTWVSQAPSGVSTGKAIAMAIVFGG